MERHRTEAVGVAAALLAVGDELVLALERGDERLARVVLRSGDARRRGESGRAERGDGAETPQR
jgi:hypothetical protein